MLGRKKASEAVAREVRHRLEILEVLEALTHRFPPSVTTYKVALYEFNQGTTPREVETHLRRLDEAGVMTFKVVEVRAFDPWESVLNISAPDMQKLAFEKKQAKKLLRRQVGRESKFRRLVKRYWSKLPKVGKVAVATIGVLGTIIGLFWTGLNLISLIEPSVYNFMHPQPSSVVQTTAPTSSHKP